MAIKLIRDDRDADYVEGVDRHYYEKQVPAAGPFGDNAFQLAAARAKDKARHKLIRAVRAEEERIATDRGALQELGDRLSSGDADYSGEARKNVLANRTVDGAEGAPDDAIKL